MSSSSTETSLGWGVVGGGRVAALRFMPALAAQPSARAVAVAGRSLAGAAAFAEEHGLLAAYDSLEALLADPRVDAVYLATPNALHAEQVVASAAAGKHVLCEKPLALSSADAERAAAACREAAVTLGVNFQYRHHPALRLLRDLVLAGEVGELRLVQAEIGGLYPLGGWRRETDLAGLGATVNMGVHAYDAIEFVTGKPILSVLARSDRALPETLSLALLELEDGAVASANANQCAPGSRSHLHLDGSRGRVSALDALRIDTPCQVLLSREDVERSWELSSERMFVDSLADFVEAVVEDRNPLASAEAGVRSAALVEALAESMCSGRCVEVSQPVTDEVPA